MMNHSNQTAATKTLLMRPLLGALLLAGVVHIDSAQATATLPVGTQLTITNGAIVGTANNVTGVTGSYFGMDTNGNSQISNGEKTTITSKGNIPLGSAIIASGSHSGAINGSETPAFDIWNFFGNTGMDYLNTAATDTGGSLLNFSGWTVTWNGIAAINMGTNAWQPLNCSALGCTGHTFVNSIAWLHGWNNINGGPYILDYSATVPAGDPSGFGGVHYYLHLEGFVNLPAFTLTNDAAATLPGTPITINVLANDHPSAVYTLDPAPSVAIASNPSNGTATANANNTVTYTPNAGFGASSRGNDSFTYTVTGNGGIISSPATVAVSVSSVLPPTAQADSTTTNGTTQAALNLITDGAVTAGTDSINWATLAISTQASHGTATAGASGALTYVANAGFSGTDSFQYTVNDSAGNTSNPGTVSVTVNATKPSTATGTFGPGMTAIANGSTTGGGLTATMVGTDDGLSQQCVGGCFDFQITGISAGSSVSVVLPLTAAIPSNAVYRKLIGGAWKNFSSSGGNMIASAAATAAGPVCPPAGSSSYTSGLTPGNQCVELTIVDNGPNDASATSGTVLDPGGVGVPGTPIDTRTGSSSGCSLSSGRVSLADRGDWWLVVGFVAWLGMIRRRLHRV
ncbi:MAG: Ig-like domain-containing protein [Sulfuricaulis sp.]